MIGRSLGGFTVVRKLDSGGMGDVYLAEHRRIHRQVAVKVLRAELTADAALAARFLTEARAASLIKHPGIVEIFDCDLTDDDRIYLVMELLEGESLAAALDRAGSFAAEAPTAGAVIGLCASALAAAHDKGIIHRDLKPENVFLTAGGGGGGGGGRPLVGVKIVDFGVAKLASDIAGAAPATQPGTVLGTPLYMSPEQCRGTGSVSPRSDVYALGCIAFEMLTGRPPFAGGSPAELLAAHVHRSAPAPSAMQPGIPQAWDALVARMLAKDPEARLGSMAEVVTALEALLGVPAAAFAAQIPAATRLLPPRAEAKTPASATPALALATPATGSAPAATSAPTRSTPAAAHTPSPAVEAATAHDARTIVTRTVAGPTVATQTMAAYTRSERPSDATLVDLPPVDDEPRGRAGGTRLLQAGDTLSRVTTAARRTPVFQPLPRARRPPERRAWLLAGAAAAAVVVVTAVLLGSLGGASRAARPEPDQPPGEPRPSRERALQVAPVRALEPAGAPEQETPAPMAMTASAATAPAEPRSAPTASAAKKRKPARPHPTGRNRKFYLLGD